MAHVPHPTHHLTQWTGTVYPFLFTPYIYNIPQWPFSAPGSLWDIMDVMQRTLPQQSCAPPNLKKTYFYINSAICRPSDLGPEPRFEPETGVLEAGINRLLPLYLAPDRRRGTWQCARAAGPSSSSAPASGTWFSQRESVTRFSTFYEFKKPPSGDSLKNRLIQRFHPCLLTIGGHRVHVINV